MEGSTQLKDEEVKKLQDSDGEEDETTASTANEVSIKKSYFRVGQEKEKKEKQEQEETD